MSRTRQKPNELDLWVFYRDVTDTNNHIEDTYNTVGHQFKAEDLGTKTRNEIDVLSGRVLQSGTVQQYRTDNEIELNIGDNIATIPNPTELDYSTIVKITTKPQNKRGARHNTKRVIVTTFEVS